ncbi:MAG: phytanoyl-CoA dioxygenase family protein [Microvirga sp.]
MLNIVRSAFSRSRATSAPVDVAARPLAVEPPIEPAVEAAGEAAPVPTVEPVPPATQSQPEGARFCSRTWVPVETAVPQRTYCQNGFVTVPKVLPPETVANMRQVAMDLLPPNEPPFSSFMSETVLFDPAFRPIFESDALIGTLKTIFGDDFLFVNEFGLQDSSFGGWHTDMTSAEGKGRHTFHWSPKFMTANMAIYLQENGDHGGGLDIVPRSYIYDDPLSKQIRIERGFSIDEFLEDEEDPWYAQGATIASKAGDATIFHMRSRHRASPARIRPQTQEERKLAMFFIVGPNNEETRAYRNWLDEYDVISNTKRPIIPDEFSSFFEARGLRMI